MIVVFGFSFLCPLLMKTRIEEDFFTYENQDLLETVVYERKMKHAELYGKTDEITALN